MVYPNIHINVGPKPKGPNSKGPRPRHLFYYCIFCYDDILSKYTYLQMKFYLVQVLSFLGVFILLYMVGDIYRYTYRQIIVYLPVHLAAIASIDSYSNSCGVDCTDRRVYSLALLGWVCP